MGSLFSKSRPKSQPKGTINGNPQILEKDRAILSLKVARDKLRRYQTKLEKDSSKLESQAKELIVLRLKNRALLVLKLRKFKQRELDGIDAKLLSIQSQINDVEWASINVSILNAIESGTRELNRIHDERSLEDVEALMDDTNEAIEVENRINMVLAGQLSVIEDAELESELEAILRNIAATSTASEVASSLDGDASLSPTALVQLSAIDSNDLKESSIVLPEVPSTPISPLISQKKLIKERTAISS